MRPHPIRAPHAVVRVPALLALFAVAACSGGGGSPPGPLPSPFRSPTPAPTTTPLVPQQISVPLAFQSTGQVGPRITVALTGGSPVSVLFDTGSTGLRLLPTAMAAMPSSSYTPTGVADHYAYGSGNVYYGMLALAKAGTVIGGGIVVAKPLYFEMTTKVCQNVPSPAPSTPPANCTGANDLTASAENTTGGGIMGVRPSINQPPTGASATESAYSPLAELPAPYASGFTVSAYGAAPKLTVGTTAATSSGFATYDVQTAIAPDGSTYWTTSSFNWCYSITANSSTVQGCPAGPALTDTGGNNALIDLPVAPPSGLAANTTEYLPSGSTFVATLTPSGATAPAISYTITTSGCPPTNDPQVYFDDPSGTPTPGPASSPPGSSNGLTPFLSNDILYDLQGGRLGFRAAPALAPTVCRSPSP